MTGIYFLCFKNDKQPVTYQNKLMFNVLQLRSEQHKGKYLKLDYGVLIHIQIPSCN